MTDFCATLDIAAKFFKNRTHFNNSKRCFLNEYQMLMSPAIQSGSSSAGGGSGARPPYLKSVPPHFRFGPPVAAYIQYCILKMCPSFWFLAPFVFLVPLLLNPGDGPYPIQFFSKGTLFTKVIKIIHEHDRLLRYPRLFSKIFKNGTP